MAPALQKLQTSFNVLKAWINILKSTTIANNTGTAKCSTAKEMVAVHKKPVAMTEFNWATSTPSTIVRAMIMQLTTAITTTISHG